MRSVSLIARGRVVAIEQPLACRVAPMRWAYALARARLPVTYSVAVRETLLGPPVRMVKVVQRQMADFDACRPLGSAACEPDLPVGDALWVLNRGPNGEQQYGGSCALMLAPYFLRLAHRAY